MDNPSFLDLALERLKISKEEYYKGLKEGGELTLIKPGAIIGDLDGKFIYNDSEYCFGLSRVRNYNPEEVEERPNFN